MAKKKHNLVLNRSIVKQLDYTLPKLKYSVNYRKIIRWLENFEELDIYKAIDFLFYLEYIDTAELTFRMNEQLEKVVKSIPIDYYIYIYPGVATYPKSTEVINYIIKETPCYKKRNKDNHCHITRDLEKDVFPNKSSIVILVDDFIGTGKSFKKGYIDAKIFSKNGNPSVTPTINLQRWLDNRPYILNRYLISTICMVEAKELLNTLYPEVLIHSEFREKLFKTETSPFKISSNISEMKRMATKYGKEIPTINFPPYSSPMGFDNTEALVAFSHTTPNNTLPIIWGSSKWYPIYPRFGLDKIKQSVEIKTEIAFYIGLMNRLGIDLYTNESIIVKGKRTIKYNTLEDHSLLCVLKLKQDGYELPSICQLLGITTKEYNSILNLGKKKGLIDNLGRISTNGLEFYRELMKKVRSKRFIKKEKDLFEMKYVNYVPKYFGGIT